ncbi:Kinase, NEK [Giardia muris]|uniref:Kinase, NEK n=1 Tax=Giardia muris TaxID=5742 RepID=A0A4Z1TBL1_GIAMU|nr:Kinase, NEK [Giardia muris]|eukprot:TNJ30637.1 Kinase, NEK [Giardia muris]
MSFYPANYTEEEVILTTRTAELCGATRQSDRRRVVVYKVRRDQLNPLQLFGMDGALRRFPFASCPYLTKCLSVQRHDAKKMTYVILRRDYVRPLADLILETKRRGDHISEAKIWLIATQICYALAYLHDPAQKQVNGGTPFLHMDIKPDTVYITEDDDYLLSIFSPTRYAEMPAVGDVCGRLRRFDTRTAHYPCENCDKCAYYTAPEWFASNTYTAASDMWAIGALLYELCTLQPLFLLQKDLSKKEVLEVMEGLKPDQCSVPVIYGDILRYTIIYLLTGSPDLRPTLNDFFQIGAVNTALMTMGRELPPGISLCAGSPMTNPFARKLSLVDRCSIDAPNLSPGLMMDILELAPPSNRETIITRFRSTTVVPEGTPDAFPIAPSRPVGACNILSTDLITNDLNKVHMDRETMSPSDQVYDTPGSVAAFKSIPRENPSDSIAGTASRSTKSDGTFSISALNPDETNSLMHAIMNNDLKAIERYIPTHAGRATTAGKTAMMLAAERNLPEVVRQLVLTEAKRTLKKPDLYIGETALMIAARRGFTKVVEVLAPFEAKLTRTDGQTAMMIAAQMQHLEVVNILAHYEPGLTDQDGWTALKIATNSGYQDIVESLAQYEAGIRDDRGETALMLAANKGFNEIVRVLRVHEGMIQTPNGQTALMCAAIKNQRGCCELLKAEVGKQKQDGTTALICAAYANAIDALSFLLPFEGGMKTFATHTKGEGYTALACAIDRNSSSCIKALIQLSEKERTYRYKGLTWQEYANRYSPAASATVQHALSSIPERR